MEIDLNQFMVGIPYQQKINYSIFKKYDKFENNAFLTVVSKGIPNEQQFGEIIDLLEPCQKLLISVNETPPGYISKHPRVELLYANPRNFHSLFNTYIYYHTGYFDPHPRLFGECRFYGKKIIYVNKNNVKDGGYFRYKTLQEVPCC